ncbi:MAG: histidine kinase [Micrococcus sp.]|nr:histidine kinase [Micrococcus sp.]
MTVPAPVRTAARALGGPLGAGWRAWLYLLLGGVLLVPLAAVLAGLLWPVDGLKALALLWLACAAASALLALLPRLRALEASAARDLLGLPAAGGAAAPGLYGLTVAHLVAGATHSAATLFLVVPVVWFAVTGRELPGHGAGAVPAAAIAVLLWVASVYLLGALLRRMGRLMLRPDPARRLAELARRDALARELHDALGHALAAISVQAAALEARLGTEATTPVRGSLAALASASREAQGELDQALGLLREGDGTGPGLESVWRLVAGLSDGPVGGPGRITLGSDLSEAELAGLDAATSRAGYRILQEATTNAVRHADGPVTVRIRRTPKAVALEVTSGPPAAADERAGAAASGHGSGLAGMRRRAALAGGHLDIDRAPTGWIVRAELPG